MNHVASKVSILFAATLSLTLLGASGGCGGKRPPTPAGCSTLDEKACRADAACSPVYDSEPFACPAIYPPPADCGPPFLYCEDAPQVCPAIACNTLCPRGYVHDRNGCNTCSCVPEGCEGLDEKTCSATAGCAPEYGEVPCPLIACMPGDDCPPCDPDGYMGCHAVQGGCASDSDCRPGERCQLDPVCECPQCKDGACDCNCPPEPLQGGTCVPADPGCGSDADCPNGYCAQVECLRYPCPAPTCVYPVCDDGSPVTCELIKDFTCEPGQTAAVRNHCYVCVDARTCSEACDDVVTYAQSPDDGVCYAFPTPCDVPPGWPPCDARKPTPTP